LSAHIHLFDNRREKKMSAPTLFREAVGHQQAGRHRDAIKCITDLLASGGVSAEFRAKGLIVRGASYCQLRFEDNSAINNADRDFQTVIDTPDAPSDVKAMARDNLAQVNKFKQWAKNV
jgi:hypothetical protein